MTVDAAPDLLGVVRPPGIDPTRWSLASWYARRRAAAAYAATLADIPPPRRARLRADRCARGHDLDDAYASPTRPDRRECRTCRRDRDRERARRRTAATRTDPTTSTGQDR